MSHFSVLVIGENPEQQLAPYHEFECTGRNDQHVVEIDVTQEKYKDYLTKDKSMLRGPDGKLYSKHDDQFYRDPSPEEKQEIGPLFGMGWTKGFSYTSKDWGDGRGFRAKIQYVPEGYVEVEAARADIETFQQYLGNYCGLSEQFVPFGSRPDIEGDQKFGYVLLDANGGVIQVIDRTNPKAKWDWHVLGGRWGGFFWLKPGTQGRLGKPSTFDKLDGDQRNHDKVDQARKGAIDFARMRSEAAEKAGERYDLVAETFGGQVPVLELSWRRILDDAVYSHLNMDEKRDLYHSQEAMVRLKSMREEARAGADKKVRDLLSWIDLEDYQVGREAYMEAAAREVVTTFAVVKDGQWHERGSMGWWGCVSDEKDSGEWERQFSELLDGLPDDTLLSVYDCHI